MAANLVPHSRGRNVVAQSCNITHVITVLLGVIVAPALGRKMDCLPADVNDAAPSFVSRSSHCESTSRKDQLAP